MVVCSSKWNTIKPLKLVVPKNVKDSRITLQSIIPKIVVFNDYTKIRPGKTKGLTRIQRHSLHCHERKKNTVD